MIPTRQIEIDLLGNLRRAASHTGPRILCVPPELTSPAALLALILAEQRGYRETELQVAELALARLAAQRQAILANAPRERDLRTGAVEVIAPELVFVADEERSRKADCEHQRALLAELDDPRCPQYIAQLIGQFRIVPADAAPAGPGAPDALLVELMTSSYGLLTDMDERLYVRRLTLGLPEDEDE